MSRQPRTPVGVAKAPGCPAHTGEAVQNTQLFARFYMSGFGMISKWRMFLIVMTLAHDFCLEKKSSLCLREIKSIRFHQTSSTKSIYDLP